MNNYNVTVVTNVGSYDYKNVIAHSEKQARSIAEDDVIWATREEVLKSSVNFKNVENKESR